MDFQGRRVTVMGLGHFGGGVAAARWLARQGAAVTVTDVADEAALADSLAALEGESIAHFHLGRHREADFRDAELVVVNPAVRPGSPFLQIAADAGVTLSSELELFLRACPARVIGVTGSNGKSTTAAMIAAILKADGRQAWLGGNIGNSLLERLDEIRPDDWAVLEISSFQLKHLADDAPLPHVAVVTGCSANHLDWHESLDDYIAAKQRILTGQTADDLAVLNTRDAEVDKWQHLVRGQQLAPLDADDLPPLRVPGSHNRLNAACAAAATGCGGEAIRRGLEAFRGLPQRLEWFAVVEGRRFYNDSASTTPESTAAALVSFEEPVWLLAGGRDKGCDFDSLVAAVAEHAHGAAFFGTIRERLHRAVLAKAPDLPCTAVETMAEALRWCWPLSRGGEVILLSPGCPSSDQFVNYRHRGEQFVALVNAMSNPLNRLHRRTGDG